ncbi:MAG: hypothetical protein H6713_42845 [Myxococcales bacterium]|nr:hypothetical protein [Myxococcales bacterium]
MIITTPVTASLVFALTLAQSPAPVEEGPVAPDSSVPAPTDSAPPPEPVPAPAPVFQPAPAPEQPQEYEPPEKPRRRGLGMMISGWSLFAGSYLITALSGAIAYDTGSEELGGALLIPVAGPLIAIPQVDSLSGKIALVFPFLAQTAGLTLGIAGTVLFARSGRANTAVNVDGVRLTRSGLRLNAGLTPRGGALGLRYRF